MVVPDGEYSPVVSDGAAYLSHRLHVRVRARPALARADRDVRSPLLATPRVGAWLPYSYRLVAATARRGLHRLPRSRPQPAQRSAREPARRAGLMFHVIGDDRGARLPELYVSPASVPRAGRLARSTRLSRGDARRRLPALESRAAPLPRKPVVLSFDDGYPGDVDIAMPTLRAHGWSGVLNLQIDNIVPARVRTADRSRLGDRLAHVHTSRSHAGQRRTARAGDRDIANLDPQRLQRACELLLLPVGQIRRRRRRRRAQGRLPRRDDDERGLRVTGRRPLHPPAGACERQRRGRRAGEEAGSGLTPPSSARPIVSMSPMRARWLALIALVAACLAPSGAAAYSWPFKPFNKQHPIRGFFGDPRTVYLNGVLVGRLRRARLLLVPPGDRHLRARRHADLPRRKRHRALPRRRDAQRRCRPEQGGRRGRLPVLPHRPDRRRGRAGDREEDDPRLRAAAVPARALDGDQRHALGEPVAAGPSDAVCRPHEADDPRRRRSATRPARCRPPLGLCGRIELAVDAFDTPPVPVPGKFRGLPVAPALVRWNIARLERHRRRPVAHRRRLPHDRPRQRAASPTSMPRAPTRTRRASATSSTRRCPASYLFLLAGNFDTTSLANGVYRLTARVSDERGNTATFTERFSVLNARNGVCPGSLPAPPRPSRRRRSRRAAPSRARARPLG